MASKPIPGGFTLELGKLYNDFWFNAATPQHNSFERCLRCNASVTVHKLEKLVFAFGKMTIKYCTVHTCPSCLNEVVIAMAEPAKKKATKQNLVKLFSKLPLSVQKQLLMNRGA